MSDQHNHQRYEELEAGYILGDLVAAEIKEWKDLSKLFSSENDISLELTASAIETEFLQYQGAVVPENLLAALHLGKAQFINEANEETQSEDTIIRPSIWNKVFAAPQTAWAVAAALAILLVINAVLPNSQKTPDPAIAASPIPAMEARDKLINQATDIVELEFSGGKQYEGMAGKVVWSDKLQEGYMTFTNLASNDPKINQYQLWIVDPTRDEKPVDGGVFDIPSGGEPMVIPINNPLIVTAPKAFVITLEQPGGVVVSKQDIVVASTANS
ncbi:anti-sigma factor [Rubritalea profundi]|uniref:Anti-sigma K factor RskA C-terminal domain-containing protein n=1 Tax=Rubritalea profundi TaxID=1658618 RepID=A0A2S7TXD1_9BACT|nr:anti-sigma factor [Rubritalea profundi]PQJ27388.1 hypothetical protein BSZ32_02000 [Rubritalea profundi]